MYLLCAAIHLLAIIIQSNVVLEVVFEAIAAPPASHLFPEGIHPDRRAASCYQDLRAHKTLLTVHQIPDVVRTFHPVAGCLRTLLQPPELFFGCYLLRVGDAVRNVLAHPAKLLFACLAFLFYCTHFFLSVISYIILVWTTCQACRLVLEASSSCHTLVA